MAVFSASKVVGLALLAGALATSGCDSNIEPRAALTSLSNSCRINSDCAELLVCVFQRCHQECKTSRDCSRDARCMRTEQGRNVCQLPEHVACSDARACPGAQVCGPDAECRDGCRSDDDCVTDQVCSKATCADREELGPEGTLTPAAEPPAAPVPCAFHSDCRAPLLCEAGTCVPQCESDDDCGQGLRCEESECVLFATPNACWRHSDCAAGEACQGGECVTTEPAPTLECDYDSDCGRAGERCLAGACRCECREDADCGAHRQCLDACQCVPGRVIEGNITINNARELDAISDVVEVKGQLTITSSHQGVLRVPRLRKAESLMVAGSNTTTLVFEALEEVTGLFVCHHDCRVDKLREAGQVVVGTVKRGELVFPSLERSGDFTIQSARYITALRVPKLTTTGDFVIQANAALAEVDAPRLRAMTSLKVSVNRSMKTLTLPLAEPHVDLILTMHESLEQVSLPQVTSLSGKLLVEDAARLRALDLRGLEVVRDLELRFVAATELNLSSLSRVPGTADFAHLGVTGALSLPALTSAGGLRFTATAATSFAAPELAELGSLELSGLSGLRELNLSKLTTVGSLFITATGLRDLSQLDRSQGGSLANVTQASNIVGNPALPACLVDSLKAALVSGASSLSNSANCVCPESPCP